MFQKRLSLEEKYQLVKDLLAMVGLVISAFVFNYGMKIQGLFMDDLYMWSTRAGLSFRQYVFPPYDKDLDVTKFRPVYWLAAWIEQGFLGRHVNLIIPFNICVAAAIAWGIYFFAKTLAKNRGIAFGLSFLFLASRFSYYNIGQFLGLMEAMGLGFLLLTFLYLYRYLARENSRWDIYLAVFFFVLNCFTHERYVVFLPMFLFVLLAKKSRDLAAYGTVVLSFSFVLGVRYFFLRSFMPAGTGGTNLADTFTLKECIKSVGMEILYLLGINTGPEHLCGIPFSQSALGIRFLILAGNFFLLLYLIKYAFTIVSNPKIRNWSHFRILLLFAGFIGGTIVSSSVTVRVEVRWIYAPYMLFLLLLAFIYGVMAEAGEDRDVSQTPVIQYFSGLFMLLLWGLFMLPGDLYGRAHYKNIYLFQGQNRANSLAQATFGKYGMELLGKDVYIIGNRFALSDFDGREFFKVYQDDAPEGVNIIHIDSVRDLGQITEEMVVLSEDMDHNQYDNVTDLVRDLKCEILYGYYRDGWMDEEAMIYVMAGAQGIIRLELMFPGALNGGETTRIWRNDQEEAVVEFSNNISYCDILTEPYEQVCLRFFNNFIMPDAQEQRGDKRLSLIVNIISE